MAPTSPASRSVPHAPTARGVGSAVATLAALLLAIAAVAAAPVTGLGAFAGARIAALGDTVAVATTAPASAGATRDERLPTTPRPRASAHAALALRAAVMLRHVALPPPVC